MDIAKVTTLRKYEPSSPEVEVSGASMLATLHGVLDDLQPLLNKYDLTHIDPDAWYPQQTFLDMFREMEEGLGNLFNLVSIGMKIPEEATMPPDIRTVEQALAALHPAYHMNNRNEAPERGWWVEGIDADTFLATSTTPYPADFEYGIVYGMVKRYRPADARFTVEIVARTDSHSIFKIHLVH